MCYNFFSLPFCNPTGRPTTSRDLLKSQKNNMNSFTFKKVFWLSFAFVICFLLTGATTNAQTKSPLLQDINVRSPQATPTPYVTKTSSSAPVNAPPAASRRTSIPVLAELDIPGYSGVLVESEAGNIVMESYSNYTFNPASNVKVGTGYAVLKTFGVNYRFATNVWTDGAIDETTGTLNGNLYVSGRDPIFNYEHAVAVANELNRLGIRKVEGNLIITDNFTMNYSQSVRSSGNFLKQTLNGAGRSRAATAAWDKYLINSGTYRPLNIVPSVVITGDLSVDGLPANVHLLFAHESAPLREIVKVTLSFSNNFLSHRLGDMLGGASGVAKIVQRDAGVDPAEYNLATTSGLGVNRVTPRAQMKLLRTFRKLLKRSNMSFADVMPVAGLDDGTLKRRFNTDFNSGSVVGKTGTLNNTDSGVSTLSGEITTRQGKFFFVIFNQRGSVGRFRSFQNNFVSLLQGILGGAVPMKYTPLAMDKRLAKSRIRSPKQTNFGSQDTEREL